MLKQLIHNKDIHNKDIFNKPLVEKYRPKTFDDIIFNKFLNKKFKTMLKNNVIQDMILTGEPSTGKTSTALFLGSKIFNNENILELNASDDRGLNVITNLILPFCKKKSNNTKLIILDEADSITNKAQQILSNIMDEFKNKVIFICNDHHKISEVIQTRCIIINFPSINQKTLEDKIKSICKIENINYDENGIKKLIFYSNYDIRQCLNNLECIKYNNNNVTENIINNIINKPKIKYVINIFNFCKNSDLKNALKELNEIIYNGYNCCDILQIIQNYIRYNVIDENKIIQIFELTSKYYIIANNGVDSQLQLNSFVCSLFKIYNN
jgi:replication factor C subunit 2/4